MFTREQLLDCMLWLAVAGLSTWVGGTLYQMLVVVPLWSNAPPESVRAFFQGTEYNRYVWRFFGPPFMLARFAPLVLALWAGWRAPILRKLLLIAVLCMTFNVILTLAYIYPINTVLFEQAGANRSPQEVRSLVAQWILADRVRFAIGLVAFAALLYAFRRHLPTNRPTSS